MIESSKMGITMGGHDLGQNAALAGKTETGAATEKCQTRGAHTNAVNHYRFAVIPLAGRNIFPMRNAPAVGLASRCSVEKMASRVASQPPCFASFLQWSVAPVSDLKNNRASGIEGKLRTAPFGGRI